MTGRAEHRRLGAIRRRLNVRDRLASAKGALIDLVACLADRDSFGLVAFDSQASIVIPASRFGDLGRDRTRRGIEAVEWSFDWPLRRVRCGYEDSALRSCAALWTHESYSRPSMSECESMLVAGGEFAR